MGAPNPILTSLLLRDSLQGRDRDGVFSATATGPVRYLDEDGLAGYWAEEGSTNLFSNPVTGNGTTGLNTALSDRAFDVVPVPAALPGWLGPLVTHCFRATATGDQGSATSVFLSQEITFTANPFAAQVMVYVPTAFSAPSIQFTATNLAGATIQPTAVDMGIRDQWQLVANTRFTPAADLAGSLQLLQSGGWLTDEEIYFVCIQYEQKAYSTSPAAGSFGSGYSWASTAHASASTRAATDLSVPCPLPGSLIVRYWDGAAWQAHYTTSLGAFGTYGSLSHDGTSLHLSVSSHELVVRDLLIYDAPLSDAQRAIVLDALDNEATEGELWGLFAGNPYTFFQLRPY